MQSFLVYSKSNLADIDKIYEEKGFYERIKEIEAVTNHDIKAVEYFVKEFLQKNDRISDLTEYVHFTCTSEDINNISHALMLKDSQTEQISPQIASLRLKMSEMAETVLFSLS